MRFATVSSERAKLAEPVLRLMYQDIQNGDLTRREVENNVDYYVELYLDDALKNPDEFFTTDWELLRDVLLSAGREELQRSTTAGVQANWQMLDDWLASDKELA